MRVGLLFALVLLMSGGAHAAVPQCNDGIDNDGDGLIDFDPGAEGLLVGADPQCRSLTWNSEASASDLGTPDLSIPDGGEPPILDGGDPYQRTDGGTTIGTGPNSSTPDVATNPPRQGCDVGGSHAPTLPILVVLALGGGLALLSRRTRT